MKRFKYQYVTRDGERDEFTVDEYDESIANVQAKLEVQRRTNPSNLVAFDLVCVGPAS